VIRPPAEVLASAPAKVAQGEAKVQGLESLPLPETQVCAMVEVTGEAEMDAALNSKAADVIRMLRIFMEVSSLEFE
jgi:hypothetical protein